MSHSPISRQGIHGVGLIVSAELKWIFRELEVEDWGIDGLIEVVDRGLPTGRLFAVQIKCGESYFREENEQGFIYRGERRHLSYWRGYSLPVVLVLYDPRSGQAFWQVVRNDIVQETTRRWKLVVPRSQLLGRVSIDPLKAVAQPDIDLPRSRTTADSSNANNRERVLHYLEAQNRILAELPSYFDKDFELESIRQRVRVSRQRLMLRGFRIREEEAIKRSGYFVRASGSGLGYVARGAEMYETHEGSSTEISSWDEETDKVHRGIILGDPGFGKTWLLKHEGVGLAKKGADELRQETKSEDEVILPIFVRLSELANRLSTDSGDINKAIADIVAFSSSLDPDWLTSQIESGFAVLLLDALDEVAPALRPKMNEALSHLSSNVKSKILVTSRIVGYQPPFDLRNTETEREFELIAFDTEQVRGFVDAWFEKETKRGKELLVTLLTRPSLGGLARIPILLSFICLLAKHDDQIPSKRVQLYETLLSRLLAGQWREASLQESNPDRIEAKILLLEEIAWHFSGQTLDGVWHDLMPSDELGRIIVKSPHAAFLQSTALHHHGLLWELSEQDGILVKAGTSLTHSDREIPYLFIHRTFHEYLLASYLARLDAADWANEIRKHLWYDIDWEEPIVLLAARLRDWRPLLTLLVREENDVFNRMLILAGRCLGEVGYGAPNTKETGIEQALIKLLASHSHSEKKQARRALVLIRSPEAESLIEEAYRSNREVSSDIASDLIQFTPAQALAVFKQDTNSNDPVRRRAAIANLAKLHNEEARDLVLAALDDPDVDVQATAAEALEDLNNEKIAKIFREQLIRKDGWGRSALIDKITKIGGPNAVALLSEVIEYSDRYSRMAALDGLIEIGTDSALDVLRRCLCDSRLDVRYDAAGSLVNTDPDSALPLLRSALSYEDLLSKMVESGSRLRIHIPERVKRAVKLVNEDVDTVRSAFLGTSSLYGGEYALSFLLKALNEEREGVNWLAANMLCEIASSNVGSKLRRSVERPPRQLKGRRALITYGLAILINSRKSRVFFKKVLKFEFMSLMLTSSLEGGSTTKELDQELRGFHDTLSAPEYALRSLGKSDDQRALDVLIDYLRNPLASFRVKVIEAIGRSRFERRNEALISALGDSDPSVRINAAAALKNNANALSVLSNALHDSDRSIRYSAARILEERGENDALGFLGSLLNDEDPNLRWHAANILAKTAGDPRSVPILERELLQKEWPWMNNMEAAKLLGEIGTPRAVSSLIRGLNSHWGAYFNAARTLGDTARGEAAVRACDHILTHWPHFLSRKREIAYDVISELAPEVRWTVGDEWPRWRARITRRTDPGPSIVVRILQSIAIIAVSFIVIPLVLVRRLSRRLKPEPRSQP
jgi:HEAT repeat protein